MKKNNLFICAGVIAAVLTVGSANAAPGYHGATNTYRPHQVTHVQQNPRPVVHHSSHHHGGHHAPAPVVVHESHHHHHHHNNTAGNIILATAILVSAFM